MILNPVLRNESKLTVRTARFTIMIFIYIALLSAGTLLFYKAFNDSVYTSGLNLQQSIILYTGMAVGQAILLMFIVPSLTSTAICSEREKQTLDILLSSKLTPFQIIIGKVTSSSLKVIMLILCTMPLYTVCALIGGVKLENILELIMFFIVNTIFVGSIGVFISTYVKTSKVATALTYGVVLFIFVGTLIIAFIMWNMAMMRLRSNGINTNTTPEISKLIYLSPATGFISMLFNQVGFGTNGFSGSFYYMTSQLNISKNAEMISIIIQLVSTIVFVNLAAIKLNPLNTRKSFRRNKKVKG